MNMSLTIDRFIKASPERLYAMWTNAEHLSQWFGVKVEAESSIGGTIRFHFGEASGPVVGKFVALEPHKYVAFTWTNYSADPGPETVVHVTFDQEEAGCRLTLRHEGFASLKDFDSHDEGWLVYMELWANRMNVNSNDTKQTSISETFPKDVNVLEAVAGWLGKSHSQLNISASPSGTQTITDKNFQASLMPCRFGTCMALVEWGFGDETQRLDARKKWQERFATLKKNG